ncbi:MAG TPA: hypothetical protein VF661_12080 [Actinomycetales bacterium]
MSSGRGVCALGAAAVLVLGGCSGGVDDVAAGPAAQTVGWAKAATPDAYVVVPGDQRPVGWDWVAQDAAGSAATVQLAVDGELGYFQNAGLAMGVLQVGPQIGTLPSWTQVGAEQETTVAGADEARTLRFTYRPEQGRTYNGAWVVACRKVTQQCIAAQVTSAGALDDATVTAMFAKVLLAPADETQDAQA